MDQCQVNHDTIVLILAIIITTGMICLLETYSAIQFKYQSMHMGQKVRLSCSPVLLSNDSINI